MGIPEEYFVEGMQEDVREAVMAAIKTLEGLGAAIEPVSLPTTRYALACYYIIAPSECSANLARYDGVKYGYSYQDTENMWEAMEKTRQHGFGPEVKRRIMLGTYALSAGYYDAYYLKAQQVRTLIRQEVRPGVSAGGCPGGPPLTDHGFPPGGKDHRPAADVPERHLHHPGQHRRPARHLGALRSFRGPAGGDAAYRAAPVRGRPCCASPTPTSRPPSGTGCGLRFRIRGPWRRIPYCRHSRPSVAWRNRSTRRRLEAMTLGVCSPAGRPCRSTTTPPASWTSSRPEANIPRGKGVMEVQIDPAGSGVGQAQGRRPHQADALHPRPEGANHI